MEQVLNNDALLAVVIFLARVVDVSLGTLRTILVFRGHRLYAAGIGFFEILIWLGAASAVLGNLTTWYLAVAYAGGFAAGNAVGMWFETKLAIGHQLVRAISAEPSVTLADRLREDDYGVVEVAGTSAGGQPVEVLLVVEKRRRIRELLRRIDASDSSAVCTVSDVRQHQAATPDANRPPRPRWFGIVKKK